jgi:hypothetical protein
MSALLLISPLRHHALLLPLDVDPRHDVLRERASGSGS